MPSLVKEMMMKEVVSEFEQNPYAFISTFSGLTVAEISEFRRAVEKFAKRSFVIKQTLGKKVMATRNLPEAEKYFKNSVLVTFGNKDPQNISKAIVEFAKTHAKLVPSAVVFENHLYDEEFVKRLAKLPSRHELLTQVVTRIKSPITGFVLTLGALTRGLVVALNEIRKKKETPSA